MNDTEGFKLHVFLCHASEDKEDVRDIYSKLSNESWIEPWLDEMKILPGQEWDLEIEKAVEAADVVIIFLSILSIKKEGYVQREVKFVLDIALEKPEGTIFIIPLRLNDCKPPRRVRQWQYVDYFPENNRDYTYGRLLESLKLRLSQKGNSNKRIENREEDEPYRLNVLATGLRVTSQKWKDDLIPSTYSFVGEMDSSPHFFRHRDCQLAVLISDSKQFKDNFLIDKYAVTCLQYCNFLNEINPKGLVRTEERNGEYQALYGDKILVVDAIDRWKKPFSGQPWLHAPKPFGITYQNGEWSPVAESDLLPVTLVSWWGARLYSLWAHNENIGSYSDAHAHLPTSGQWQIAASWDPVKLSFRAFPWGDNWDHTIVNFSGFWAKRNIIESEWHIHWENNPHIYSLARPLSVAALNENISPAGCVQMLGNTWEWNRSELETRLPIRGGCATSPMEYCAVRGDFKWAAHIPHEYIGFRCSYQLWRI